MTGMDIPQVSRALLDGVALRVVATGIVALAVAMGVGRFAFTPLLPLMLRDGTLSAVAGAEWAAANYVGYLAGALTASAFVAAPLRGLLVALVGVAVSTLAVGFVDYGAQATGAGLRVLAGVFSAWALICASAWCLPYLAHRRTTHLGAWIYTGVGLGIALTGTVAWIGGTQPARWLWLELGALACFGAAIVAWLPATLAASESLSTQRETSRAAARGVWRRHAGLLFCYGAFGFGYIVPATFLPAMAREHTSNPLVFGLTWPVFGVAAVASVAASARWLAEWPRARVWALAQAVMASGTGITLVSSQLPALALTAALVGGTFMVTTMAGLQLARELEPRSPAPLLAALTVAFALGQIAGPVVIRLLGPGLREGWDALAWANGAATVLLAGSSLWLWHFRKSDQTLVE
jgi:MFS family permease